MSVVMEGSRESAGASGPGREAKPDVAAFALAHVTDPRLAAVAPGFDAPFQQAGLAGYSDAAMRIVAREWGCPFAITEALLDRFVADGSHGSDVDGLFPLRDSAEGAADRPLAVQLMGADPETMAAAATRLVALTQPDGPAPGAMQVVDVNLACPVKKVAKKRRGGHWLADPDGAIRILAAVRAAVPTTIATTVKLRRGTDDTVEAATRFRQVFEAAYELGYAWATVHARTVEQRYVGPSRWPFLAALVRDYPDRLILGSGDIWRAEDIFGMLEATGVSAVSVARGCVGDPWIFRRARALMNGGEPAPPTLDQQRSVLLRHFELATRVHGEARASLTMRKFGVRFAQHHPDGAQVRAGLSRVRSAEEWRTVVADHYSEGADVQAAGAKGIDRA
jgi:tRNA-dihydrouridine synthase